MRALIAHAITCYDAAMRLQGLHHITQLRVPARHAHLERRLTPVRNPREEVRA